MDNTGYAVALQKHYANMVSWRRHLHRNPELSFREEKTSSWIAERLKELGCEVRTNVGGHGVIATIRGNLPGPAVALRADIDALPIQDAKQCEYASTIPGVMHACGHDAHTASLLGAASYYMERRSTLAGERRLLFQPAEEVTPGGALSMIADGALSGVDVIYGVHLWTPLPYGQAATKPGPFMASPDEFYIDITGKGGHGALPHETVDAVVAGSAFVQAVQSVVSRSVNPLDPAVVTVGSFQAGTTANVIAEQCHLKGTVRSFTESVRELVKRRMEELLLHVCSQYGASGVMDYRYGYPPVVNDVQETERFFQVADSLFGPGGVRESEPVMAGEDFAYYLQQVPGCFMFVGAGNEACGAVYPHHHPKFDLDERSMVHSAALLIGMAEHYAAAHGKA
ncbi:M20 metallopeptidase family protein [Paenibacillus tarimensis]|uniref:M20 metallopeptidase family protein n=1 Tax=Paenibacillus tarimensis TaxID=416012 RepID=UPI001F1776FC|nr:amidohydrolase [Paenibacillus tarimensis]MCF2942202.1 amidohydrolase [Paenibacillus tarimensis]